MKMQEYRAMSVEKQVAWSVARYHRDQRFDAVVSIVVGMAIWLLLAASGYPN